MSVSVGGHVHLCAGTHRGQERVEDTLEQELQAVLSHPTWVLETERRFSGRAASVLNY